MGLKEHRKCTLLCLDP